MRRFSGWAGASFVALGSAIPMIASSPAVAASFSDVNNHWARVFIERLADTNVIAGFPDGSFRPDQPVTRAQFAAIVRQAFDQERIREYRGFNDVPGGYWATPAITEAYEAGFLSGYPGGLFQPNQEIPKVQVLVSLASGLRFNPNQPTATTLRLFQDAQDIPAYAVSGLAAATERGIVVNYPNVRFLNPNETATRGDVAAYIYQALVNQGRFQPISNNSAAFQYIVAARPTPPAPTPQPEPERGPRLAQGTRIPLVYPGARTARIILAVGETVQATLQVETRIVNAQGEILLPENSRVEGRFVPIAVNGQLGTQFLADRLLMPASRQSYRIEAISRPKPAIANQDLNPQVVRGAVLTPGAQQVLSRVLGEQNSSNNLFAGILEAVLGQPQGRPNRVVIFTPADLEVTLQAPVRLDVPESEQ